MTTILSILGCIAIFMMGLYGLIILNALIDSELIEDFIERQTEYWEHWFDGLRRKQ